MKRQPHYPPPVSQSVSQFVRSPIALLIVFFVLPVHPQAQENYQTLGEYPIPVSESVEQTAQGTMVFLSYPKYYRDAEEKLVLVETELVTSSDPDWDYEVSKGIWQLKVKTDGTFQAQHEGDVFTYRFQNLGIGQGSAFRSVDLGEPDFSKFEIIGDTIRWTEVLPDIDLTVRYIHDILKVDVIVKKEFMNDLRAEVKSGGLSGDNYLTARFDIPSVFITSQAKQGDQARDIYAEPIEFTNAPLTFERDGKVLHKLRPVESYVLDEKGEPMYWDFSNEPIQISSSQRWQLQRGGGGFAEMSANLGDLANAPEGDVVIDPVCVFGQAAKDTLIRPGLGSMGNAKELTWKPGDHLLFSFTSYNQWIERVVPKGMGVRSAKIGFYLSGNTISTSNNAYASPLSQAWGESWRWESFTPAGGYDVFNPPLSGKSTRFQSISSHLMEVDVTAPLKDILSYNILFPVHDLGFLVRMTNPTENAQTTVYAKEKALDGSTYYNKLPRLTVDYSISEIGADSGNVYTLDDSTPEKRLSAMKTDNLKVVRWFSEPKKDPDSGIDYLNLSWYKYSILDFFEQARLKGMKVIICYKVGEYAKTQTDMDIPSEFKAFVQNQLWFLSNYQNMQPIEYRKDYIANGTIIGIEFGNEEEAANTKWTRNGSKASTTGGAQYADFYYEFMKLIREDQSFPAWKNLEIIGGGSFERYTNFLGNDVHGVVDFYTGFLGRLESVAVSQGKRVYDYMPDSIAIHTYTGQYPPEGQLESGQIVYISDLLTNLHYITYSHNFFPNYDITEYGFSPTRFGTYINPWAPTNIIDNCDVYKQGVYYLRSRLIHGTLMANDVFGVPIEGTPLKRSLYFHHPKDFYIDTFNNIRDYGFHNPDPSQNNNYLGSNRACRDISKKLYDPNYEMNLGLDLSRIISPFKHKPLPSNNNYRIGWCAWESGDVTWVAVWIFMISSSYEPYSAQNVNITIPGDFTSGYQQSAKRFNFNVGLLDRVTYGGITNIPVRSATASFDPTYPGVSLSLVDGNTQIQILTTTENPVFIKFEKR